MTREEREGAIKYIKSYRKLDEDLHNTAPKGTVSFFATKKCLEYWDMAIKSLEQEPKIGYWIHHKETLDCAEHWECSRCHRTTMINPSIVQGNDYNAMHYCPKCGAKMSECEVKE